MSGLAQSVVEAKGYTTTTSVVLPKEFFRAEETLKHAQIIFKNYPALVPVLEANQLNGYKRQKLSGYTSSPMNRQPRRPGSS